ncbi:MAG: bifunctional UDP-N-acetylglucosamine diphosphorylase/glucosamine-1-phosphate N-acetyltransferase GlmU [Alphaproteobacteria bacterium]
MVRLAVDLTPKRAILLTMDVAAIILAAGKGTRMKSDLPKVMHKLAGRSMLGHVLASVARLGPARTAVVVGPGMEAVARAVAPVASCVQGEQLGTGDAVKAAREVLDGFAGTVLVLFGDTPFIQSSTLENMIAARAADAAPAVVVLGFRPGDPGAYGRLVVDGEGLQAIVEARDASPEELAIDLCNSGVMAIDGEALFELIDAIGNDNSKGEFYLTDIVRIARDRGLSCAHIEADEGELLGVNSRADLAVAEAIMQGHLRAGAMAAGVTLSDPQSVWFAFDTEIGNDVSIGPNVFFGPGVSVASGAEIKAFSHIEGAEIAAGATVGPFARLRPGARIGKGARIGNFVEIKNALIEAGAKVNHLSYVGDARVGARANVGAGTITCNYDGFNKSHTDIGAGAFIGSNTALVAPVRIGDGAIVGAGSTITKDVAGDALALTRAGQKAVEGWAAKFRAASVAKAKAGKKRAGG